MLKSVARKVMWVGRTASMVFGLALVLALLVGVASAAFGANGGNFILGQLNKATAITKLNGNVSGGPALQVNNPRTEAGSRALQLGVAEGQPPLTVNATAGKAKNLNADKIDGLDSSEIGVNGVEQVSATSPSNSTSPKTASATCPDGKVAVGGGARIQGSFTNIALDESRQHFTRTHEWVASAHEVNPTENTWRLDVYAVCVLASGP
jgi:hypothetical protein